MCAHYSVCMSVLIFDSVGHVPTLAVSGLREAGLLENEPDSWQTPCFRLSCRLVVWPCGPKRCFLCPNTREALTPLCSNPISGINIKRPNMSFKGFTCAIVFVSHSHCCCCFPLLQVLFFFYFLMCRPHLDVKVTAPQSWSSPVMLLR